ncbi:hypothetical protein JHK87_047501 [Glycine soja]|nr:hypothetical protein JHK87_047501 [Glycine soja]
MEAVQLMSTTTIKASSNNYNDNSVQKIDLTPWDLQFFHIGSIQRGLLFRKEKNTEYCQIEHLQHSLSSTLAFFPLLAGRLAILEHHDNTVSSHIVCDNKGVPFVHAAAHNTTVADILQPKYVPPILRSFFALNGVKNYEATSQPVLAVQVTELFDGIFIALSINHVVADGTSFWLFVNSWAEISRGSLKISKFPSLKRCFLDGVDRPIRFLFTKELEKEPSKNLQPQTRPVRVFHFTKEKIADLKSKANAEANTDKISSLQALLANLWRSVIRCQHVEPHEEIQFTMPVGVRPRVVPPLPEDYFGNAALIGRVTMKAGELLQGELGKIALEINKMISSHSDEKVKNHYESWARTPRQRGVAYSNTLNVGSSPRFNIYGNDFGWGKPMAVRSGGDFMSYSIVFLFAGFEEGSIDIEVFLPYEILEAMGNDPEFMHICHSE